MKARTLCAGTLFQRRKPLRSMRITEENNGHAAPRVTINTLDDVACLERQVASISIDHGKVATEPIQVGRQTAHAGGVTMQSHHLPRAAHPCGTQTQAERSHSHAGRQGGECDPALDDSYFRLNLGLSAVWTHGRSGFIQYDRIFARDGNEQETLTIGGRFEF